MIVNARIDKRFSLLSFDLSFRNIANKPPNTLSARAFPILS